MVCLHLYLEAPPEASPKTPVSPTGQKTIPYLPVKDQRGAYRCPPVQAKEITASFGAPPRLATSSPAC